MTQLDWRRIWAVVAADLRQLGRQRSAWIISIVLVLTGIGLTAAHAQVELAAVLPGRGAAETDDGPIEPEALCVAGPEPRVVVTSPLPDYLTIPGTVVAEGTPGAVAGVHWLARPDHPYDDGELLYWREPSGTSQDRTALADCLRAQIIDERDRRLEALGITFRSYDVLRLRRHGPPKGPESRWWPRLRWLDADLPAGLDLVEVLAAILAMLLGSGQVVDGILRNRTSGWEETLGLSGLRGAERVVARIVSSAGLSAAVMLAVSMGSLLAAPFTAWLVHPGRLFAAFLTPLSCGVVLVVATRGAPDVRAATARVVFPFALLLYGVMGALSADLVWLPIGGPLVLAVLGGDLQDWVLGIGGTLLPTLALVWAGTRRATDVHTNHGDRQTAGPRHARGRFGPEALVVCALGVWALVILPLVAGTDIIAAHLVGQVAGLGMVALVAPRALGLPVARTLALHRPSARSLASAALLPFGTVPLMFLIFELQRSVPWVGTAADQAISSFAEQQLAPLAVPLGGALIWAVPAVFEELFFRGAVLGLLLPRGPWARSRGRTVLALAVQAVAFGLVHMLAARWIPTGILGLALGVLAVRSRSVLPGMLAHALHNLAAVGLSSLDVDLLAVDPWLLALGAAGVVPALFLASAPPPGEPSQPETSSG